MRSNDIIFGFCNDIFNFALFQQLMLNDLNEHIEEYTKGIDKVELGNYYHHAGSLHLYEMHYDMRDNILMDQCFSKEKNYELNPWITRKYIEENNMTLPIEDMPKLELMAFTIQQMEKLFI